MTPLGLTLGIVIALSGSAPPARHAVWARLAHRLVARIADQRLTPTARAAVAELLGGQSLADASAWADDIRGSRRETAPLHYVNIPLRARSYDPARDCPGGRCIIAEIQRDRQALADPETSAIMRGEALRFLVHFVADLHQPLHVSDNDDKGGNLTQVQYQGRGSNLHRVWDLDLVEAGCEDEDACVTLLTSQMKQLDLATLERGTVTEWAMEGHRVAAEDAYRIPSSRQLGTAYVEHNLPLAELAIIKAGVRLAAVLNQELAGYRPSTQAARAPSRAAPGVYSDAEALAHAGETATVVGTVVTVKRTQSGNIYLNFGADYPRQTFSGAVLNPRDPALRDLAGLAGKRVAVTGTIRVYRGQAEILIERRDQIEVRDD